jgi:hypothetical protein
VGLKGLEMWTPQSHNPQRQLATIILDSSNQKHPFRGQNSPDLNRANNEERDIPEIPCQISSEVRGYI